MKNFLNSIIVSKYLIHFLRLLVITIKEGLRLEIVSCCMTSRMLLFMCMYYAMNMGFLLTCSVMHESISVLIFSIHIDYCEL